MIGDLLPPRRRPSTPPDIELRRPAPALT